jgi:L(+)-tartrate dehydratase alpha subunit
MIAIEEKEAARDAAVKALTEVMSKFTSYIGKRLPTDVQHKLADLRGKETHPLAKAVYQSMKENQPTGWTVRAARTPA